MPSEKASSILRSRTDLTDFEIASLSEPDAWKRIYELDQVEKAAMAGLAPQICFTGFGLSERISLERVAKAAGLEVKESVTTTLKYLCAGPNAGPSKLEKARSRHIPILSAEDFLTTYAKI